jgi:hypothetical protein
MFFGKEVSYVYAAMELLSKFRTELDLGKILSKLIPEDKTNKRQLRAERTLTKVHDPYRFIDHSGNSISWQNRYLYQQAGKEIFFSNIGFYSNKQLTGGTCYFDGERWRLCTPKPNINDNLISGNHLKTVGIIYSPQNNQFINDHWWIRNEGESEISISSDFNCMEINLEPINTKNIYLSSTVKARIEQHQAMLGKYMTFSADVYTSHGEMYLTLGGVGESGYHHKNSPKNIPGTWTNVSVTEQFLSINTNHKDSVFVRMNLAADAKAKKILIKNLSLQIGYFPMGVD